MTAYLFDTNVVSELRRPRPDPAVVKWVEDTPPEHQPAGRQACAQVLAAKVGNECRHGYSRRRNGHVRHPEVDKRLPDCGTGSLSSTALMITGSCLTMLYDLNRGVCAANG